MPTRDERLMLAALREGRRGVGRTRPNPAVGAVIVRDDAIIARGYHRRAGSDHAEVAALRKLDFDATGTELFVTLEPCAHHGRTPPCTEAILRAGIRRVVIGAMDPNPRTDGRGRAALRAAGLEVTVGVRAGECAALIEPYASLIARGRPLVLLKLATTLDGRIATRSGDSRWVTGEAARREVHRLRNRCDAVLVGGGTVRADDPALTCRLPRGGRDPLRVILSAELDISPASRAVTPGRKGGVPIVATTRRAPAPRAQALRDAGADVVRLPARAGRVRIDSLLDELGGREVTSLLVEGGGEVAAGFLAAGAVDRVVWFVAPKILGGRDAIPAIGGVGAQKMERAIRLREVKVEQMGADLMITGRPIFPDA